MAKNKKNGRALNDKAAEFAAGGATHGIMENEDGSAVDVIHYTKEEWAKIKQQQAVPGGNTTPESGTNFPPADDPTTPTTPTTAI